MDRTSPLDTASDKLALRSRQGGISEGGWDRCSQRMQRFDRIWMRA
ncbi:MAG TPA: hypothetical protein VM510_04655 [Caulifigura sp.]|nr:hypothetical protein [Caulifigura sp.]